MNNFDRWIQNSTIKIQQFCGVMAVLLVVLTLLNGCLARLNLSKQSAAAEKTLKESGITMDQILARRDSLNALDPQAVVPYTKALDNLEAVCTESRVEIGGIASAIVKKEKQSDLAMQNYNNLEAMGDLLFQAEIIAEESERKTVSCIEAFGVINHEMGG